MAEGGQRAAEDGTPPRKEFTEETTSGGCFEQSPPASEGVRSHADGSSSDRRLSVVSPPPEFKLNMLVTDRGRLKMVHSTTRRMKSWQSTEVAAPAPVCSTPTRLVARPQGGDREFVIRFDRTPHFRVGDDKVVVSGLGPGQPPGCPVEVGDRVVAVNGMPVLSKQDFRRLLRGAGPWSIRFRPRVVEPVAGRNLGRHCSIEFSATELSCMEDQGSIQAPLRRKGDLSERCVWQWRALNENVAPDLFGALELQGQVVWEPGQDVAKIELKVPNDKSWNAESLYIVYLEAEGSETVESVQSGVQVFLGPNRQLSIYSLNTQSFPDGAYGNLTDAELAPSVRMSTLAWKFIKHTYTEIPADATKGILLAAVPSLLYYVSQVNFGILVNCGLRAKEMDTCEVFGIDWAFLLPTAPSQSDATVAVLAVVCFIKVLVALVEHVVEKRFRLLRLGGKAGLRLRANILTTTLQMSDGATEDFDAGDILKAMDTHAETAVRTVWVQAFVMFKAMLGLCVKTILTLQIVGQLLLSGNTEGSVVVAACLPIMIAGPIITFLVRRSKMIALNKETCESEENWAAYVSSNISGRPLIRTYNQACYFVDLFRELLGDYNAKSLTADAYSDNTMWVVRYVFLVLGVAVLLFGGRLVGAGQMSAGDFLVLVQALEGFGAEVLEVAEINRQILLGTEAVHQIAGVLNAETYRLEGRKQMSVEDELAHAAAAQPGISLRAACFRYAGAPCYAVPPVNLDLPAGGLICFSSPTSSAQVDGGAVGVNTLFRMIAGRLLPQSGAVVVPPRWRPIYIPATPILFDGTLMYNLMFSDRASDESRVWDVCAGLGMSAQLIGKPDFDVGTDGQRLRFSDRVIVVVARALMHDVDVLLLSSCLDVLGESSCIKVVRYLRRYSAERGYQHHLPRALRHEKTILYTSKFEALRAQADHTVRLDVCSV